MSTSDNTIRPAMRPVATDSHGCQICVFDRKALESLIGAIQKDPAVGKTLWSASTRWQDGFQSEAEIRGFRLQMDEPEVLGARTRGPTWSRSSSGRLVAA